ncbi:hypothetical protein CO670_17105 [Rhizobium sp. J15]|uniref:hypothetical protein n=1 Tax=Rhizobium sp. J15 TaxID=2035450 RepID=UPI000BE99A2A|nr:hypothetical protein [Rhizobium sp. J15]PDT15495.1 hypothetical protein CO670_17105 [Rhizobium sp. J15]
MLTTDWGDKLIFLVIGAVVAWLLQQIRVAWAEDIAVVNEHIKDIEKLSEAGQNYWLKHPADKNEDQALAARVRAAHAATTLLYPAMAKACGKRKDEYERLSIELFTEATGGNFESGGRTLDPSRAIAIHDHAVKLIHLLRISRRGLLSLRRLGKLHGFYDQ